MVCIRQHFDNKSMVECQFWNETDVFFRSVKGTASIKIEPVMYNLNFARIGGFHMPRKRDFACAQQAASKGETIVNYCEPLVTPHMDASGSPIG